MKIGLLTVLLSVVISGFARQYDLAFKPDQYKMESIQMDGKSLSIRCFENIVYVQNPVDTNFQKLNIYVPEAYFRNKKINNYSAANAPVFFTNAIGGYMSSKALTLYNSKGGRNIFGQIEGNDRKRRLMPPGFRDSNRDSAIHQALRRGYIVVSAGSRGRDLKNAQNVNIGKAPASLVDLKAAVRYLRLNDKLIPGDMSKIISNGTSAGGAMSCLLGATGDHSDYLPYLKEIGAANSSDAIYAVSAYCPITDLEHADCAYEWQFNGINTYEPMFMGLLMGEPQTKKVSNDLTLEQLRTSNELKLQFPVYLNSLGLRNRNGEILFLDENGDGSFKEYIKSLVVASAQRARVNGSVGVDSTSWLIIRDNKIVGVDFVSYIKSMKRMKTPPAFDSFDLSAPENSLFGDCAIDAQHFTKFSYDNASSKYSFADSSIIKMMNPLCYIDREGALNSTFWHIRYGTIDNNASLAIPVILATYLENKGARVDFELAWNKTHTGDYGLFELFNWIDSICK